ncbi:MAG: hypothetical protein ACYSU7_03375 [Planctomycetota bacterium]|jgi:hypothetical protein
MASRDNTPDLAARVQRLATATLAIGFTGAVVASRVVPPGRGNNSGLQGSRQLLRQVHQEVRVARADSRAADRAARVRDRGIRTILGAIDEITGADSYRSARAVADGDCTVPAEPAVAYLSSGYMYKNGGNGSVTLQVAGSSGVQQFTFASGTSQLHIITAINSFQAVLGVTAARSPDNDRRVSIASNELGSEGYVRVKTLAGPGIIHAGSVGGEPLEDYKDYGSNAVVLSVTREPAPG